MNTNEKDTNNIDIEYIIKNKRGKFKALDFSRYLPLPIVVLVLTIFFLYSNSSAKDKLDNTQIIEIATWGFSITSILVIIAILMYRRLISYTTIETSLNKNENHELIVKIYGKEKGILSQSSDHLTFDYDTTALNWGDRIILIPMDSRILVDQQPIYARIPERSSNWMAFEMFKPKVRHFKKCVEENLR